MLILTRNIGESLNIGDEISVTILNTHDNQVKIGINAPKHIAVDREEIYRRKKNNPLPPTTNQSQTPPKQHDQKQSYALQRNAHDSAEYKANSQSIPPENPIQEQCIDAPQLTGNILFIKKFAGYGFIYAPGQDENIYFHAKDLLNSQFERLEEGRDVSFRLIQGPRGLMAKQIEIID